MITATDREELPVRWSRQNNSAGTALIESDARIDFADDRDSENRDKNGRLAVECVFVLTFQEKLRFLEGIKKHGPLRATQLMYLAVATD